MNEAPGAAESEERLRAILHTAVDAIVTIEASGTIESVNPAAERMFGYTRRELLGRNVSMLMPPPWRDEHDRYIARYLRTGEARIIGIGREIEAQHKSGGIFPVDLAVSEVRLPDRLLFTAIIRDLTERREIEEQARLRLEGAAHTARLLELGEMCSGIVHEVNQPLAAIVSFADGCLRMVRGGRAEPALVEDTLGRVAEQGLRAGEILSRLHGLARREESRRETFDLGEAIGELLPLVDHERRRRGVRVEVDREPGLPAVSADRVHVEQILLNLLRNAFHAVEGADDRRVWVRATGATPGPMHGARIDARSGALPGGARSRSPRPPGGPSGEGARESSAIRRPVNLSSVNSSGAGDGETGERAWGRKPAGTAPAGPHVPARGERTARSPLRETAGPPVPHADRQGAGGRHADVRLVVEDSGPGIAPERRERVFEPFYTTRPNGLGVGLAISRSLAERHGGRLRVEAGGAGGARFVLELPCAPRDP